MKTIICIMICTIIIALGICFAYSDNNIIHQYPMTAVVNEIKDDLVYCVDCNGNIWIFEGSEDWQEDDIVSLLMDNMGTTTICDDEIIATYYSGTVKGLV